MKKHTFVILAHNESDDLEECIKSVVKQSVKSNIVIATSTPNDYILELASNYSIGVMINEEESNKGSDYNYAINAYESPLLTIAHQDDLYDRNYTKEILKSYKKNPDATIIFTDNYEISKDKKIIKSKRLFRKRYYLFPLSFSFFQKKTFFKMRPLTKDKFICTSSITFVKKNIQKNIFPVNLKYDNDWRGLIDLAKEKTKFVYIRKPLVGYRVDNMLYNDEKIKEDDEIIKELRPRYFKRLEKKRDKHVQ